MENNQDTAPIAPASGSPILTRGQQGASGEMRSAPLHTFPACEKCGGERGWWETRYEWEDGVIRSNDGTGESRLWINCTLCEHLDQPEKSGSGGSELRREAQ